MRAFLATPALTAVPSALSTLRFVLSNRPGAVEVQAPPRASVYLLKNGVKYGDIKVGDRRTFQPAAADGSKARFAGLSPGPYRAFVVDGPLPSSQASLDESLRHSTAIAVEEGQTASVTLGLP